MNRSAKKKRDPEGPKKKFYEQEGSSRAITSSAFFFTWPIIGSILLWYFNWQATGNPGLAYFGIVTATVGIFQIFSTGFGNSFVAKVKAAYIEDPELALTKASSYIKLYIVVGGILASAAFILTFFIPDPFIQIALLMTIPPIIITYTMGSLSQMVIIENRFDINAFVSSFYGTMVFLVGMIFIGFKMEAVLFTLIPLFTALWLAFLNIIFCRKISPFSLKDIYTRGKAFSSDSKEFLKYSIFSTLTNLESIGFLGNIIVFITTISLFYLNPVIKEPTVIAMTFIMTYVISTKVSILFFSGPLNIEIAEAVTKKNKDVVQTTITDIGRIASILGLSLLVFLCGGAGHIIKLLHLDQLHEHVPFISKDVLLLTTQVLMILFALGQACYGFAALFGNALIGSGHAKYAAICFTLGLILTCIFTPLFNLVGPIGAGISMFATGIIILPYMMISLKKQLNVELNFRIWNQIPYLIIVFLLLFFYPLEPVLDHIIYNNNLPVGLIGLAMLLGIIFAFIIGIPFFGVMGPGDGKLIKDVTKSFKAEKLGNLLIRLGRFFYYLNPLHKKP